MTGTVLDTDVVIATLDRADAHHPAAAAFIRAMDDGNRPLLLSTVNYAEALVRPAEQESTLRAAVGATKALGIDLVVPTASIAIDAARLRGLGISLADGFALATARARGAAVGSFDKRVHRAARATGVALGSGLP